MRAERGTGEETSHCAVEDAVGILTLMLLPHKAKPEISVYIEKNGAPERIRTSDPQIRSLMLYPAELRARDA